MTKTGIEMTTRVDTRTRLSRNPPFLMPVRTPAMMPRIDSKRIAMRASFAVIGYRSLSSSMTLMPLVGLAEVALDEVAEVLAVLDGQRVVEVVLLTEGRGVRRWTRPLSALAGQWVAREGEHHGEDEERRSQDHRDHLQQSSDDVCAHVTSLRLGPSLGWDGVVWMYRVEPSPKRGAAQHPTSERPSAGIVPQHGRRPASGR